MRRLKSLSLVENSKNSVDWQTVLGKIVELATSDLARVELENLHPLKSSELALESFSQIEEVMGVLQGDTRPLMESLDVSNLWLQRLSKKAVLRPIELKDIRHFCLEVIDFKEVLRPCGGSWVQRQKSILMDAQKPLSAINHIMFPDGGIRTDASEKLYESYREKSEFTRSIQKTLDRIVKDYQLEPVLQDRYVTNRQGRWVLPIKSGMRHNFDGIIHASSQSQKTVFMEPSEVIPINNRLKRVESEIEEEVERLLTELSSYLYSLLSQFENTQSSLLEGDMLFAKAQFSLNIEGHPCKFHQERCQLVNLRHPLLELNPGSVVPNTVQLDDERRVLLLSGPNAGGKTVLLKAFGLAAHMARCGLLVAADCGSEVPFFKEIFINVGDAQSVGDQLSTFVAHLKQLNEALALAKGREFLVLVDEICSSTDPEEGSALARSFICQFAEQGCFAIITSHFGQLKKNWDLGGGIVNGSLEFRVGRGPTYQFCMGVPGQSLAIQTARQAGVSPQIIDRAMELMSPEYKKYQEEVNQLGSLREQLQQVKSQLDKEKSQLNQKIQKYEKLLEKFQSERQDMLEQVQTRAEHRVDQLIQKAKVDGIFRKHTELQKMKREIPQTIKSHSQASAAKMRRPVSSLEEVQRVFPPGSKVYVRALQRNAIIQGEPNSRGEVPILSDSMRLMVSWESLESPQTTQSSSPELSSQSASHQWVSLLSSETHQGGVAPRSIDVRGSHVSEALKYMEEQLDVALLNQESRVKVIHGHGTEVLKRSVRNYLSRCSYVTKWNSGQAQSEGDGITWVFLKES